MKDALAVAAPGFSKGRGGGSESVLPLELLFSLQVCAYNYVGHLLKSGFDPVKCRDPRNF